MSKLAKILRNQALGAEAGPGLHWTAPELLRRAADEIERLNDALSAANEVTAPQRQQIPPTNETTS